MIYPSDLECILKLTEKAKNKAIMGENPLDEILESEKIITALLSINGYGKLSKSKESKS